MVLGVPQDKAFQKIKIKLSKQPVLYSFDLNASHRVSAVLLQIDNQSNVQPVEYASRKMTDTQQWYAMVDKRALAITWACEKFDFYVVERKFDIETDHKPLI